MLKKNLVMEVKIQIPDNCELIKDGDTYVVKEKKQTPPRSWEEFCKRYPVQNGEYFITPNSSTVSKTDWSCNFNRHPIQGRNWCVSMEEAEAFLALMQLRQLRKAWIGDWEPRSQGLFTAITSSIGGEIVLWDFMNTTKPLSFPTKEMAKEFLNCFRDLCETAKILL